jgi:O-antigen ligase
MTPANAVAERGFRLSVNPWGMASVAIAASLIATVLLVHRPIFLWVGALIIFIGLALITWPDVATLLVIAIVYSNAAVVAVQFHDLPYLIGAVVPGLLLLPLAGYLVIRRQSIRWDFIVLLMCLFLAIQIAGLLFVEKTNLIGGALERVITFVVEGLALYFLILNTVRSQRLLYYSVWLLIIVGLVLGSLSFYQQITGTFDNRYGGFAQISNAEFSTGQELLMGEVMQPRLAGPLGDQNRYAQIMLMLAPLALFRVWSERSWFLRGAGAIAAIVILVGMGLTFSRGAIVGLAGMLVAMIALRYIKLYQVAFIAVVLSALILAVPNVGGRLLKLENLSINELLSGNTAQGIEGADTSTQNRIAQQLTALYMFLDHPILGVGSGFYRVNYREYAKIVGLKVKNEERESHTLYLGLAAENGILGLSCMLAIFGVVLRNLHEVRKRWLIRDPQLANIAAGLSLAIIGYLVTAVFLHFAYIRFFWLMMGLAGAATKVSDAEIEP